MNQTGGSESLANGPETWDAQSGSYRQGSTLDQIKSTVAEKLRVAAGTVQEKAEQMGERNQNVAGYGQQAAGWLNRSADYVQDFSPQHLKSDIEEQVRRNPGRSLLIAGAAGLILGAILRRR